MTNLASCYIRLGRDPDAVLLLEESLEFQRRVLPESHPDIGEAKCYVVLFDLWVDWFCHQSKPWPILLSVTANMGDIKMLCCCLRSPWSFSGACRLKAIRILVRRNVMLCCLTCGLTGFVSRQNHDQSCFLLQQTWAISRCCVVA